MDNMEIIKRFEALETERRSNIEEDWQKIENYVCPGRGRFFLQESTESELKWRRPEVYDSTAITAAASLASAMHSALTSVNTLWFDLRFRQDEHNKRVPYRRWLEEVRDRIWQELQDSNFSIQAAEMYMDLVCFGSAMTTAEEIPDRREGPLVNFKSVPIRETFFEEGYDGQPMTIYRRLNWTPLQIIDKFGAENVPDIVNTKAAEQGGATTRMNLIFCVWERTSKKDADTSKTLAPLERPYGFKYVLRQGRELCGKEGGYYEMPAFLPRYALMSGSRWGYSPAMQALPTISSVIEYRRLILKAAEKVVDPPIKVTERGLVGDIDIEPAGLTVLRELNAMEPYESKARFDVSSMQIQDMVEQIRFIFLVPDLQLKESPQMTATEVMERVQHMQRRMAPVMARLQDDFLDPLITRVYKILFRAGKLPAPPEEMAGIDTNIDIQYVSPLARALKQDSVSDIIAWSQQVSALAEVHPEVLDVPDWDGIVTEMADALNIKASMRKPQADIDKLREDRKKQMDAQIEAETAKVEGEAMQALGEGKEAVERAGVPVGEDGNVVPIQGAA